ncbi:MAG: type II secretion system protein [Rickettsiales bacterium]
MQRGFSLVELSIVLVILGLLTGGILAGQSLIRASELRAVSTEYQRYIAATQTFRDKYFAIPGDFNNAVSFWGRVGGGAGQCATPATDTDTGLPTCNGDGSSRIDLGTSEPTRYWEHLATTGLIEGSFSGIGTSTPVTTRSPASKLANAWWNSTHYSINGGDANFFAQEYAHILFLSDMNGAIVLRPEEAWNIDTKLDDGRPAAGRIWAGFRGTCTNSTSATDYAATYLLSSSTIGCGLLFARSF